MWSATPCIRGIGVRSAAAIPVATKVVISSHVIWPLNRVTVVRPVCCGKSTKVAKLAGLILAVAAMPVAAGTFTGRDERVIDGDTIVVRVDSVSTNRTNSTSNACPLACTSLQRVRLAEIDAPEMKTPRGPASRRALCNMILHKQVIVTWTRRGRYRRIIGQVYLDGEWINLAMVAQGWATHFKRYSRSGELAEAERQRRLLE